MKDFKINLKAYYQLTKPGIIRGNAITATAGYFLATGSTLSVRTLLVMLGGLSLIIAAGCVYNNFIDREIDKKMARTKDRALVSGTVSSRSALIYASALLLAGTLLLVLCTNKLTLAVALTGFIFYVFVYAVAKRKSVHGTAVGSISGAVPPVVGYCAVTNDLDEASLLLFLILVLWQMPHFYAIAMYRINDYRAAGIPVLPIVRGLTAAKRQMLAYVAAFAAVAPWLWVLGYAGYLYLTVVVVLSLLWLRIALRSDASDAWAGKMFGFSLVVLTSLSAAIIAESILAIDRVVW